MMSNTDFKNTVGVWITNICHRIVVLLLNNELERILEGSGRGLIEISSRDLPGKTEKNFKHFTADVSVY
jgi:hypothetical protein